MFFKKKDEEKKKEETPVKETPPVSSAEGKAAHKKKGFSVAGKIFCSLIALGRISLSVYSLVSLITSSLSGSHNKESYLTLSGKNVNETRSALNGFDKSNQKKLKDYYFIGTKRFVSECRITPSIYENSLSSLAGGKDIALRKITFEKGSVKTQFKNTWTTHIESKIAYINLRNVDEGDYILCPFNPKESASSAENSRVAPYSIDKDEGIEEILYTLPDKDGKRKRITLKNNRNSPYTILNVKDCGTNLPGDRYDILLRNQQYRKSGSDYLPSPAASEERKSALLACKDDLESSFKLKAKVVSDRKEAVKEEAIALFTFSDSADSYGSLFVSSSAKTLEESDLKGYDEIPEIREAVGALEHAGEYYSKVPYNCFAPLHKNIGKESCFIRVSSSLNDSAKTRYESIL